MWSTLTTYAEGDSYCSGPGVAVKQDCSAEPNGEKNDLSIRFRIDGECREYRRIPAEYREQLVARIKIMARLNIAERRMPQDGKIRFKLGEMEIELRVVTLPTAGENEDVVLRILAGSGAQPLGKMNLSPDYLRSIQNLVASPYGMVLAVGPTGSGKTTTLHAMLGKVNAVEKKVWTVEDPVEYEMKGVNQVSVKNDIGRTFAHVLRHFLRQDPDVIMVGEIRDGETAEIAIQAANTGHLVFSTLHTNDAPSAFTRLIDMGMEPFLVADAIEAVMAQRLVRTICPECKTEQVVSKEYLLSVEFPPAHAAGAKFWQGAGCDACGGRGYQGRSGIYELLRNSEAIQQQVINRAPASVIGQLARSEGMKTLREYGWGRAMAGVTTIEEVLRVTQISEALAEQPVENF